MCTGEWHTVTVQYSTACLQLCESACECGLTVAMCPLGASSFSAVRFGRVDVIPAVVGQSGASNETLQHNSSGHSTVQSQRAVSSWPAVSAGMSAVTSASSAVGGVRCADLVLTLGVLGERL